MEVAMVLGKDEAPPPAPQSRLGELLFASLAAHTRNARSQSPNAAQQAAASGPAENQQQQNDNTIGKQMQSGESARRLLQPVQAGETVLYLGDYSGLAIGDVVELNSGTPNAEVVVIQSFDGIHLVAATRNPHEVGTTLRRLVEGTGERYDQHAANIERLRIARSGSRTGAASATTNDSDLDSFESHDGWSPREKQHQMERFRRRQRAARLQSKHIPMQ